MKKEIAVFVEGHGFGHAARLYKFIKENDVKVITFKDGARFFEKHGIDVIEIKEPYPLIFNDKEFDLLKSFGETLKLFDVETVKILRSEIKDSSLVLVDSSLLGFIFAKAYKKKLIFLSNNTDISVFFTGQKAKILGDSVSKLISYANKILISDFPPPYSISKYNVKPLKNMEFIGPLVDISSIKKGEKEYGIVSTGSTSYDKIQNLVYNFDFDIPVYSRGYEGKKITQVKDVRKYIGKSKWIISHGGHSTIMESILFGVPMVLIPQENYAERMNNARAVKELGLGVVLDESYLSPLVLEKALEDALDLKDNLKKFSRWGRKFNANKRLVEIVEGML